MRPLPFRVALGLVVVLLAACTAGPASPSASPDRSSTPPNATPASTAPGLAISAVARASADPAEAVFAATAINDFGLELLRGARAPDDNAVLSPTSIALGLTMARAGAVGETASQMDVVLRALATDDHSGWLNALDAALAQRSGTFEDTQGKDTAVLLRIANATFAQEDLPWRIAYLEALASRYGAGLRLVDYVNDTEHARRLINAWVDERTEERIPELLAPGVIDNLTRLVLVNAIYLKAAWLAPFDEDATKPAPFRLSDGSVVTVPTMSGSASTAAEGDGWRAVEKPYVGRSLAMTIIVPDDLEAFEAALDGARFAEIVAALQPDHLKLSLPRFGIESKLELNSVLADMGMPLAFDPDRADFSGMVDPPLDAGLHITDVVHQANIDVDEAGTEAAAATAVVAGYVSMPRPFNVDRPFLFALRDVPTGAILFLGRVVEPEARS